MIENNNGDPNNSVEELLKIIETDTSYPAKKALYVNRVTNDVISFINHYKVSNGDLKVPADLVYTQYKLYVKKPVGKNVFLKEFATRFVKKRSNKCIYFLLNKGVFNLPDDFSMYKSAYVQDSYKYRKIKKDVKKDNKEEIKN
jgi:hypothetical protein